MRRSDLAAGAAGLVFALGLGIAGMTQPAKVAAFLDVAGDWDPSLALVMVGAIGVHAFFARPSGGAPRLAPRYELPTATRIDGRLLAGAALFGLGWGAAGFCPGPAVVSIVTARSSALLFVAAMVAGMLLARLLPRGSRGGAAVAHPGAAPEVQAEAEE